MSAELQALVTAGLTSRQIAEHLGLSYSAAQRRLVRAGITAHRPGDANRDAVARLTRQGLTSQDIAAQLGICARQVTRHRTAAGVAKPTPTWWTPEQITLYEHALTVDGWSYGEVARTYGAHRNTLAERWPDHGWEAGSGIAYRRMIERLDRVDAEYWANRYARAAGQNGTRAAA